MRVIGWTNWDDSRDIHTYRNDPLYNDRRNAVIRELREKGYRFSGSYHQNGEYGVPVFDDGKALAVTQRSWGAIMADAFPKEVGTDEYAYCVWAWINPEYCPPSESLLPNCEREILH